MANFNLNKVVLGGRLTADPELKQTSQGTSVTTFTIAIDRRFARNGDAQQKADFISTVAWRQTAEFICKYFRKGSSICVTGSIQTRSWTDQNGQKRYATEVVVEEANFVDSKSDAPRSDYLAESAPSYATAQTEAPKFEELSNDDDLPF